MFSNSECQVKSNPNDAAKCQSCGNRRLGSSRNNNNSINRALRDLQTSTEVAVPSGAAAGGVEELLEGLFELNIEMDIPNNESSAKPLPFSMTTTVAVIGFGSILSVVSSMM